MELDEGSSNAGLRMELVECNLEKHSQPGIMVTNIMVAKYLLALYYSDFARFNSLRHVPFCCSYTRLVLRYVHMHLR